MSNYYLIEKYLHTSATPFCVGALQTAACGVTIPCPYPMVQGNDE
jgi:hypothetical protein